MPVKPDREYREMQMLAPTEEGHARGYATTFDSPYLLWEENGIKYYEKVDRHALDAADMSDVVFLYNHSGMVFARTKNKTLQLWTDDKGYGVDVDLTKTADARNMHENIISGNVDAMSWAFTVQEDSYDRETHTRTILKIKKVYDVSAVCYPANPDTFIGARSYVDGVIAQEAEELREREAREKTKEIIKILLEDY